MCRRMRGRIDANKSGGGYTDDRRTIPFPKQSHFLYLTILGHIHTISPILGARLGVDRNPVIVRQSLRSARAFGDGCVVKVRQLRECFLHYRQLLAGRSVCVTKHWYRIGFNPQFRELRAEQGTGAKTGHPTWSPHSPPRHLQQWR
jgi:hypothetical protein